MILLPPTTDQVRDYLRQRFKKPWPGWIMHKIFRMPLEYKCSFGVWKEPINEVPYGDLFQHHGVYQISIDQGFLQHASLPGRSTYGYFAWDGAKLRYLSGSKDELQAIFRVESPALEDRDPQPVASLLTETLLDADNHFHDILLTLDSLVDYSGDDPDFPNGYRLNTSEFEKVRDRFQPISLKGNREDGWKLTFSTVYGWMHLKRHLGVERFSISREYEITSHPREVLSRRIFTETPAIVY